MTVQITKTKQTKNLSLDYTEMINVLKRKEREGVGVGGGGGQPTFFHPLDSEKL